MGKGAARFDADKLASINAHYMREAEDARLLDIVWPMIESKLTAEGAAIDDAARERILAGMPGLKERAKNTLELAESAEIYARCRPLAMNERAAKLLSDQGISHVQHFRAILSELNDWHAATLHDAAKEFAEGEGVKLGKVAQPLRAALTGSNISPGVFEVMEVLGRDESLARLEDVAG